MKYYTLAASNHDVGLILCENWMSSTKPVEVTLFVETKRKFLPELMITTEPGVFAVKQSVADWGRRCWKGVQFVETKITKVDGSCAAHDDFLGESIFLIKPPNDSFIHGAKLIEVDTDEECFYDNDSGLYDRHSTGPIIVEYEDQYICDSGSDFWKYRGITKRHLICSDLVKEDVSKNKWKNFVFMIMSQVETKNQFPI